MTSSQRITAWIVGIIALIAFVFLLAYLGNRGSSGNLSLKVEANEHIKGNPNATVTLVEYSDFECPACASYYPVVEDLVAKNANLRVVYRHFPLVNIHENAMLAAQAAEAAARQGKFWELHDSLFNTQSQWQSLPDPREFFTKLATSIGLNKDQFSADLESDTAKNAVREDLESGQNSGVNATPTFYLNGEKIQNPDLLPSLIAQASAN